MSELDELDEEFGEKIAGHTRRGKCKGFRPWPSTRPCSYTFPDGKRCRAFAMSSNGGNYCRHHEPKVNLP